MSINKIDERIKKLMVRRTLFGVLIFSVSNTFILLENYIHTRYFLKMGAITALMASAFYIWAVLPLKNYFVIGLTVINFMIFLILFFLAFLWV
ncbi:MAG: hypothetical protein QXH95_05260 [Thermoplasmata archaeon]